MSLRLKEYETASAKPYNLLRTSLIYSFDLPAIINFAEITSISFFVKRKTVAPAGFEPASPDPESGRIDHYPTGL